MASSRISNDQQDEQLSPVSDSDASSIDITDECYSDITNRIDDAELTDEEEIHIRVYLQPGVPHSYSAEELTSLIACMSTVTKQVTVYLHHFTKDESYLAFLNRYRDGNALIEKRSLRSMREWKNLRNSLDNMSGETVISHLDKNAKDVTADLLLLTHLDRDSAQASSSSNKVRNLLLMDRSVSDDIRAAVTAKANLESIILGQYENVLELPDESVPLQDSKDDDFSALSHYISTTIGTVYETNPNQAVSVARQLGMMFASNSNPQQSSTTQRISQAFAATPPHVPHVFSQEGQGTPQLKSRVGMDDDDGTPSVLAVGMFAQSSLVKNGADSASANNKNTGKSRGMFLAGNHASNGGF